MKPERYAVTIYVEVYNKQTFLKAARDRAAAEGHKRSNIIDTKDAVHWLLDPGTLADGATIEESTIEQIQEVR